MLKNIEILLVNSFFKRSQFSLTWILPLVLILFHIYPTDASAQRNIADKALCQLAIQNTSPRWTSSTQYVNEAKRRGLTERQCARLTGKFGESKLRLA